MKQKQAMFSNAMLDAGFDYTTTFVVSFIVELINWGF